MKRWFRTLILFFGLTTILSINQLHAQIGIAAVSGRVAVNETRVFVKDTLYRINGNYTIAGTLVIEPGTTVEFLPNSHLVDSVGGRIIADGRVTGQFNNPFVPFLTVKNPGPPVQYYTGYADLDYFANSSVTSAPNVSEPTVNSTKGDNLFRVNLSQTDSRLQNLTVGKAIMYKVSRIEFAASDLNLNQQPWSRLGNKSVNVTAGRITFRGRAVNNFSVEWGHIVVLPGARVAYFRDVDFQNFRKDTTVDRTGAGSTPYYTAPNPFLAAAYDQMNSRIVSMTSGSGGALTTFSVRTWLVNCVFENNLARYHGGAAQFLQAPFDNFGGGGAPAVYPDVRNQYNALPTYPVGTNPNITDPETGSEIQQQIPAIDNLATPAVEPFSDANRQLVDDARLSIYLGRVRELTFRNNQVLLSNIGVVLNSSQVPVGIEDKVNEAANVDANWDYKNEAQGGALYIAGRSQIEVALGNNDGFASTKDFILLQGNTATNLQPVTPTGTGKVTRGARGGAVYVGDATSVIFSGRFANNRTQLGFNPNIGDYSQGGAIYVSSNSPRIQLRGGQTLRSGLEMQMVGNKSGRGGAIYAYLLTPTNAVNLRPSPVIGGSDATITTRNYGFNIKFDNNEAVVDGGAIYANKRMSIRGSGGTVGNDVNYGGDNRVEFKGNIAGISGGAIAVNIFGNLANNDREVNIVRAVFESNTVGQNVAQGERAQIKGGGAIYAYSTVLTGIKGVEFLNNKAYYGNGGAIALIAPGSTSNRFFGTDLDGMSQTSLSSSDDIYTWNSPIPADARSLTRFLGNEAIPNMDAMGSGATQEGDVARMHPGTNLAENGTGLGGAVYVLDNSLPDRGDRIEFNRVRFQDNKAYSGAVVYSDNYNLMVVLQRSLVTGNIATSDIGAQQNAITGPYKSSANPASSDLAGAVMYGEILGPLPFQSYHVAANAIYDNQARFLIRLPDAPNTKGIKAGTGLGKSGVDTLRGNYWGRTEANVNTIVPIGSVQETFFVAGDTLISQLPFIRSQAGKKQGPFESPARFSYTPIPVSDDFTVSIPEKYLQQGQIYDLFDKGTDIKAADYSDRRMSRIEDFAVGIPPVLRKFTDALKPSANKVIKRWTRNPFDADKYSDIATLQTEFVGVHPIGYPLFLEAQANYSGDANMSNNDERTVDETVFFVINDNTGDYVRVNLQQISATSEVFRGRVEFIPDELDRPSNPLERRTAEGLANFGSGGTLLNNLYQNALNEDAAALEGRKYEHAAGALGGVNFQYSNRPSLPASTNNGGNITYFGGERFTALPVRSGDRIRVISRTVLWSQGVNEAIKQGLDFNIGTSTQPPIFTGDRDTVGKIVPVQLRNMVFLQEDYDYPTDGSIQGRTNIFDITGTDTNKFFDPRWVLHPNDFTALEYMWSVDPNSGLNKWLQADTLKTQNPPYGSTGFIRLKGHPSNPYIVPGGEEVTIRVRSFPPTLATIDSLRSVGAPDSVINRYLYLYRSYFNAEKYDVTNARYLQQDTVNVGLDNFTEYKFRIQVVDSIPVFTTSATHCGDVGDLLVANVTDSLRFYLDVNTDDELEDAIAQSQGWNFRYGKTAYGFQSISKRNNPDDSTSDEILQVRPIWLSGQYLLDDKNAKDPFGVAFTENGILNSRIDFNAIKALLTPLNPVNNSLNTDTVLSIVVNDGHGGINQFTRRILINFAPRITTETLQQAIEDQEYNPQLFDTVRAIKYTDPNFGQAQTFRLLYASETGILKDPCFPEAGNWDDISSTANTPKWLRIDPVSGRLFGTPRVEDAPRLGADAETVTVLITDDLGLTHMKQLKLEVQSVNHPPHLAEVPVVKCVAIDEDYTESFKAYDLDLKRSKPASAIEKVTLKILAPVSPDADLTITPSEINGTQLDSVAFTVTGKIHKATNPDGTTTIKIVATDSGLPDGQPLSDTLTYQVSISDAVDCLNTVTVKNSLNAFQELKWGTAIGATTGEDELGGIGNLDVNFCEFEIPPIPPLDVFDARWTISTRNGVVRTIVPRSSSRPINAVFQAGGVVGNTSTAYPVEISWDKTTVCKPDTVGGIPQDYFVQDPFSNGNIFKVNMRTGDWQAKQSDVEVKTSGNTVTIVIKRTSINAFQIIKDRANSVDVPGPVTGFVDNLDLQQNYPNPFGESTYINFGLPQSSDIKLEVFDAIGNKVATLANGYYAAGVYHVKWDAKSDNGLELTSGVYTYRLSMGLKSLTRQMILIK